MAAVKTSPQPSEPSSASSPESSVQFQAQKRKGGRKPVYATQEERKLRNRAAQAAFRERRTEYIKHLEATIKHHEEQLSSLQQSSRNAAEEVLMLRYKTSLLERILLEKGIDVQSELRAFSQGDSPQSTPMVSVTPQQHRQQQHHMHQQQMHRQSISRQSVKRSSISQPPDAIYIKNSPVMQPTPVSRATSPTTNSSAMPTPPDVAFISHNVSTPVSDFVSPGSSSANCVSIAHNYYPSPYQAHMEELEQEYEAETIIETGDTSPISPLEPSPHHHSHPHSHGSSGVNAGGAHMSPIDHMGVLQSPTSSTPGSGSMVGVGGVGVPQQAQGGLQYNVGTPFECLDQLFKTSPEDLTDGSSIIQYNLPFTFATSNLR